MIAEPQTLEALDRGDAFVELIDAHVTRVSGADARTWLNDLVTTDVASLGAGDSRPSLLLTPTGRIRAQFHVAALRDGTFALIEREPFDAPAATALDRYLLSSQVELATTDLVVVSLPGVERDDPRVAGAGEAVSPSILGGGVDVLVERSARRALLEALHAAGLAPSDLALAEARRIRRGDPRFGFDLDAESLPAEAGLDVAPVTDRSKGCFLGQESIAKIANLGHPTRLVAAVRSTQPLGAGEPVLAAGEPAGVLTSADGTHAIARIAWAGRDAELETAAGAALERLATG